MTLKQYAKHIKNRHYERGRLGSTPAGYIKTKISTELYLGNVEKCLEILISLDDKHMWEHYMPFGVYEYGHGSVYNSRFVEAVFYQNLNELKVLPWGKKLPIRFSDLKGPAHVVKILQWALDKVKSDFRTKERQINEKIIKELNDVRI